MFNTITVGIIKLISIMAITTMPIDGYGTWYAIDEADIFISRDTMYDFEIEAIAKEEEATRIGDYCEGSVKAYAITIYADAAAAASIVTDVAIDNMS